MCYFDIFYRNCGFEISPALMILSDKADGTRIVLKKQKNNAFELFFLPVNNLSFIL